jgi:hypothetical protein
MIASSALGFSRYFALSALGEWIAAGIGAFDVLEHVKQEEGIHRLLQNPLVTCWSSSVVTDMLHPPELR